MPGKHHCILTLLLCLPQAFSIWLLSKNRYRLDEFYHPSKKCLRGLKMASANRSICVDLGTCVVYCDQWACPKKPNGSLTEFDATDDAIIYELFHLGLKDEIWPCWNQQEFWYRLQWKQDLTSCYLSPKAQVLLTHQASSWWLLEYSAWKDKETSKAQSFVACSSTQRGGRVLELQDFILKQHTKMH